MSSTDQAPTDAITLISLGTLLMSLCIQITTFTLIYGIFILLFAQSTAIFTRKHLSSAAHKWMFLTSASSFLLATLQGAAFFADTCIVIQSTLIGYQDIPLDERLRLTRTVRRKATTLIVVWTCALGPIISDSIVIWRAFVLLKMQRKRQLIILPLLILLGSIATTFANVVLATMGANITSAGLVDTTYVVGLRLSLATNVVATALIGYIYWLHRKATVALSPDKHRPTEGLRILVIFVESGVVFCVPQAIYVVLGVVSWGAPGAVGYYIGNIFTIAYFAFALTYPTLVIVLVNRRHTLDQYISDISLPSINQVPTTNRVGALQPISFAPPARLGSVGSVEEITDQDEKNRASN